MAPFERENKSLFGKMIKNISSCCELTFLSHFSMGMMKTVLRLYEWSLWLFFFFPKIFEVRTDNKTSKLILGVFEVEFSFLSFLFSFKMWGTLKSFWDFWTLQGLIVVASSNQCAWDAPCTLGSSSNLFKLLSYVRYIIKTFQLYRITRELHFARSLQTRNNKKSNISSTHDSHLINISVR